MGCGFEDTMGFCSHGRLENMATQGLGQDSTGMSENENKDEVKGKQVLDDDDGAEGKSDDEWD